MWRDISTAPKDGSSFLAWHEEWGNEPLSILWNIGWGKWSLNGVALGLGDWGDPTHWHPHPPVPNADISK